MRAEVDRNTSFNIRRSTALMIGGAALVVCGCVAAIIWILAIATNSVDETAANGESRLVQSVFDTYQSALSQTVIDYATWDDMFDNFVKHRSATWEKKNMGPSI